MNNYIHCCWLGDKSLPPLAKACMHSWAEIMPNYSVRLWGNDDIPKNNPLVDDLVKKKQWAFVSDYMRLDLLYRYGGIYLDIDIELIRSLEPLTSESKCVIGEELPGRPTTGVLIAPPLHPFIKQCIDVMEMQFKKGRPFMIAPEVATTAYRMSPEKVTVLPSKAFYPYNPYDEDRNVKQLLFSDIQEETYAIHHWAKNWDRPLFSKVAAGLFKLFGRR